MDTVLDLLGNENLTAAVLGLIALVFGVVKKIEAAQRWKLQKALEALEAGVRETYVTYVRQIKLAREDGKLTADERSFALQQALAYARRYAAEQGVDLLKFYGKEYLPVLVERIITGKKSAAAVLEIPALPDLPELPELPQD